MQEVFFYFFGGLAGLLDDGVGERADAVYFDAHGVSGLEPAGRSGRHADSVRGAGEDDGPRKEGRAPICAKIRYLKLCGIACAFFLRVLEVCWRCGPNFLHTHSNSAPDSVRS